jgi:NTE family protein
MITARILFLLFLVLFPAYRAPAAPPARPSDTLAVRLAYDDTPTTHRDILQFREVRRPRLALVLSGGGARGLSQIGVLKVLEKHHIPIDFIASTSIGAIVGGLYAAGYSTAELEHLVTSTNWDELLSLSDETQRSDLFVNQKVIDERTIIAIRFQGFEPVIPPAVSSGQRLTDFLSTKVLQAPYHAFPDFDHLAIPFRAVATDLISGNRVVLNDGSLAEALRASSTVPLLFNPIERDSMKLVDGGLVDNIPVDLAREQYDVIVAVNTTSGLRREGEMNAPWQTADQILGIMMERMKADELRGADITITPDIGRHLSSDFSKLDFLIAQGEQSAEERVPEILALLARRVEAMDPPDSLVRAARLTVQSSGIDTTSSVWRGIENSPRDTVVSLNAVRQNLRAMFEGGEYEDLRADITGNSAETAVRYIGTPYPVLAAVEFRGSQRVPADSLEVPFRPLLGRRLNHHEADAAVDSVLRIYRARGYSLAKIDSAAFDRTSGVLGLTVYEGEIHSLSVEGGVRTQDPFVMKEFPLSVGDVFEISKAQSGLANLSSTGLFEYVYLEVSEPGGRPALTIRLRERPSQLMRLGLRVDNERNLQGLIDIRDENFHGIGTQLGFLVAGGQRNLDMTLSYDSRRMFNTYLTFGVSGFYRTYNSYVYTDAVNQPENHWDRVQSGEYKDIRYGGMITFGTQLEKLGEAAADFTLQNVRLESLDRTEYLEERYQLSLVRIRTTVDTKDSYPFPNTGVGLQLAYEFAFQGLGSDISYNALSMVYESFTSLGSHFTFHPKATLGFADRTMPLSQQYRLGGMDSFFGLREDDQRGRQLLLVNLEFRYFLPVRFVFDTYFRVRYDLGTISAEPEQIKFSLLRHGIGAELAWRTPLGPARFGAGTSFYFSKDLPENPIQQGPLLFYFMIGYQL